MSDRRAESRRLNRTVVANVLLASLSSGAQVLGTAATLEPVRYESAEGYYQLHWEAEEPVRLVESTNPEFGSFSVIYTGSDSGHVASGKPDGTWYYRLESADGSEVLSDVATITVRHHSLARAFSFFALGAVVFVATLGLIVFGNRETNERA